jgi:HSP20 family protein
MNIIRYQPFGLRGMDSPFNRMFRDFVGQDDADESNIVTSRWMPLADIQDAGDHFLLEVDVPGVKAEEINVTMENGVLNIEGERRHEERTEERGYSRIERSFGSFHRRFSLPETADAEAIEAKVDNGVLNIRIGKAQKAQPRRIEVKA